MNVLSLCSGVGGIELGLHLAEPESRPVYFVEKDPFAREILARRWPGVPIHDDIYALRISNIPRVDVITAGFPCFAAGSMVLTEDGGYVPIEEIEVGCKVLTHTGRWRRVTATMSHHVEETLAVKYGGSPGVTTTSEHPFLVREKTFKGSVRVFSDPVWAAAATLTFRDFAGQILPSREIVDENSIEFWWIVGRYLADGWRVHRPNRSEGSGRVVICSSYVKAQELETRLVAAGFHANPTKERTVVKYHITRNDFYQFLAQFGRLAHGKRIPGWIYGLSSVKADAFLSGYLSGDGYYDEKNKCHTCNSVSKSLALGIALLAQRARGVVASVRVNRMPEKTVIEGRVVNQRDFYTTSIPRRNNSAFIEGLFGWKQIKSITRGNPSQVYNLAVDVDESYVVEGAVVHNCQPWALCGKQKGINDERWIFPEIAKIIRNVGPKYVFLENVPGLLQGGFSYVLGPLADSGFDAEWMCLSCADLGGSHLRERVFLLARSRRYVADAPGLRRPAPDSTPDLSQCSPWPPGPKQSWQGIPKESWPTKPPVRRVDHDLPKELDLLWANQLRVLGNAVAPVCAAAAWRILKERLSQ